jgi:hypothetical protein
MFKLKIIIIIFGTSRMIKVESISTYKEYLSCIRNWEIYSPDEQELLKAWYRKYYRDNKEKERQRYRQYYKENKEKERLQSF